MFCTDVLAPYFLIFSNTTPHLLYYSHLPAMLVSLFFGLFVFLKNKNSINARFLFYISVVFFFWSFADIVTWVNVDSRIVMLSWSLMNILEPMLYLLVLFFSYSFVERDKNFFDLSKLAGLLLLIPVGVLVSSKFNIKYFDISKCEAVQGGLMNYVYFLEIFFSFWIIVYLIKSYIKAEKEFRGQVFNFSLGVILFLLAFSWANIFGNLTTDWNVTQYGLFGMPVFLGFLGYIIVKYKAFNVKLLGAQAIMVTLIILIASQFSFIQNQINKILTGVTLALAIVFGWQLVRSVKKEVAQREELEVANERLKQLDQAKSDFISIASHQLRTPLTVIKGYISMIMDGNFGAITTTISDSLNKVYISNQRLINLVEDLLNISRIESGRLQVVMENKQLEDLVASVCDELEHSAEKKGLKFEFIKPATKFPAVRMDEEKMRQVVMNLIDNSIKYTPKGSVTVSLKLQADNILFCVSDSGLGVRAEDMPNLFKKFSRGTGMSLIHTEGTGLGLYVVKQIVKIHGGRTWIESAGEFKGSKFYFEMPFVK